MKKHLFVNGTSVASGWGTGHERVAQPGKTSWAHHLAAKIGADELWNVSVVSKPIPITIEHTIGFCEQYFNKYNTFEDLFVAIEMTLPQNERWKNVSFKGNNRNEVITPIVVQLDSNSTPNADIGEKYQTVYVRHDRDINYLSETTLFHYIPRSDVESLEHATHTEKLQEYDASRNIIARRLYEAGQEIAFLQKWLVERNIAFIMFWAAGIHPSFQKRVDKALLAASLPNRLIPMQMFTAFSKGAEWSINPYLNHPDEVGQYKMSEFLYEYIMTHDLFEQPSKLIRE